MEPKPSSPNSDEREKKIFNPFDTDEHFEELKKVFTTGEWAQRLSVYELSHQDELREKGWSPERSRQHLQKMGYSPEAIDLLYNNVLYAIQHLSLPTERVDGVEEISGKINDYYSHGLALHAIIVK